MQIQDFFNRTYPHGKRGFEQKFSIRPRIICNDGFSMSVQANEGAYCEPRKIWDKYYFSAEIGFPSEPENLISEFAEEPEAPTETVYGYVPLSVINEVIKKHGGINEEKTFNL